jgi:hypothetical protein
LSIKNCPFLRTLTISFCDSLKVIKIQEGFHLQNLIFKCNSSLSEVHFRSECQNLLSLIYKSKKNQSFDFLILLLRHCVTVETLKVVSLEYTPHAAEMTNLMDLLRQFNRVKCITLLLNKETFKEWEPSLIQLIESNTLPFLRYLTVRLLSFHLENIRFYY